MKKQRSFLFSLLLTLGCKIKPVENSQAYDTKLAENSSKNIFETMIAQENIFDGQKRLGIDPVTDLLKTLSKTGDIAYTLIPQGRSLQAPKSDWDDPRIVLAITNQNEAQPLLAQGRLFIGYARKANQLEVIAYNEGTGRYDFQTVADFQPGGTPKIHTPPRSLCTTCHQGGGPIFSLDPWSETSSAGPKDFATEGNDQVRKNLVKNLGKDSYLGFSLKRFDRYPLFDSTMSHDSELLGIGAISGATAILALSEAWRQCGVNNRPCREDLLLELLNFRFKKSQDPPSPIHETVVQAAKIGRIIDGRIADRVPGKNGRFLPPSPEQNPKSPRALSSSLQLSSAMPTRFFFVAKQMMNRHSLNVLLAERGAQRIVQAEQFPFTALYAMTTNQSPPTATPTTLPVVISPTTITEPKQLTEATFKSPGLKILSRYCSECHSSSDLSVPAFLKGTQEDRVLAQVRALLPNIAERIRRPMGDPEIMPAQSTNSKDFFATQNGLTHAKKIEIILDLAN